MHYVIIGNGGAGTSALQSIRSIDKTSDITIISKEPYPAYSPCSLPNLIAGELEQPTIYRFDKKFYQRYNAQFLKNTEALQIHIKKKEIKTKNKPTITYDKLLIAAGASPITPKAIKGLHLEGVHIMGTLDSTLGIIQHLKQGVAHAVVVGGGFIGVETAVMLRKKGINVTLIELLPHILLRMLDADIAKKVEKLLIKHGITLKLGTSVQKINGTKKVRSVSLDNTTIPCDMVITAIGVRPNIDIVKESEIAVNQGIIVDTSMQTNVKDVYAAGDIAEVKEQIRGIQGSYAIWPNAIEQGRIAGLNMAGKNIKYDGADLVNVLDIFNIPVVALGWTSNDLGKCKVISRNTPRYSKKILLKNNKIVGLQFIRDMKNLGPLYSYMKNRTDVRDKQQHLLDDNLVISPIVD